MKLFVFVPRIHDSNTLTYALQSISWLPNACLYSRIEYASAGVVTQHVVSVESRNTLYLSSLRLNSIMVLNPDLFVNRDDSLMSVIM